MPPPDTCERVSTRSHSAKRGQGCSRTKDLSDLRGLCPSQFGPSRYRGDDLQQMSSRARYPLHVAGYGPVAFELGEILDEDAMRVMSTLMHARHALLRYPSELSPNDPIRVPNQVHDATCKDCVSVRLIVARPASCLVSSLSMAHSRPRQRYLWRCHADPGLPAGSN